MILGHYLATFENISPVTFKFLPLLTNRKKLLYLLKYLLHFLYSTMNSHPLQGRQDALRRREGRGPAELHQGPLGLPEEVGQGEAARVGGHCQDEREQGAGALRRRLVLHKVRLHRQAHLHQGPRRRLHRLQDLRR